MQWDMKKNVIHFLNHITDFSYIFHALGLLALGNKYVSVCFVQVWYKKATKRDSYSVSYPPDKVYTLTLCSKLGTGAQKENCISSLEERVRDGRN